MQASAYETSVVGILDAMKRVGIRVVGRGIPNAVLVMRREFVSRRVSSDVRPDAINDVGKRYPEVFLASSDIVMRWEPPPPPSSFVVNIFHVGGINDNVAKMVL